METDQVVDLTGLKCPMPIVRLTKQMKTLVSGEQLTAIADDPAFCLDVEAWCQSTGYKLIQLENDSDRLVAVIQKM